jgi:two-component system CheB/CheR fusion protein
MRPMVIGVGASAGGLEALGGLVRTLELHDKALVVVQHLSPDHESLLTQLLAREARGPVTTAADGMPVVAGTIYVIPPNADLALHNGLLCLSPPGLPRLPIDFFFDSLAADQGANAAAVVLSGTGSDGSRGLQAVKAAGGATFVQEPSTAKYDGMPRSAVSTGAVDFSLPVEDIAKRLAGLVPGEAPVRETRDDAGAGEQLARLLRLIKARFGTDLSLYKTATIERRIERRMALCRIERLPDYLERAESNATELEALYRDMLITVTSFFRDGSAFDSLKANVLPALVESARSRASLRFWVPACATGEEAYSLAICALEVLRERGLDLPLQVFGTDIDDSSVRFARRGSYPPSIATEVSAERLAQFFVKRDDEYQVSRSLRDVVVFSHHDVLKDPPFSRLDLVSCRNLLIYLQPNVQRGVLRRLHYSLNLGGYLLLGTSETVGDAEGLFVLTDPKNKLYAKKQGHVRLGPSEMPLAAREPPKPLLPIRAPATLATLADRKVIDRYVPPGIIVNEALEVLHFRGRIGRYLDPPAGAASLDLLRVAHPDLHIELRRVVKRAFAEWTEVTGEATLRRAGVEERLKLEALPLDDEESGARCVLVTFNSAGELEAPAARGDADPLAARVKQLEHELESTRQYVQAVVEEKEGANDQLRAANEELQSSNEELQSTNEELETSKEELQSTNEELVTVNDELHSRMGELGVINDDLHNVLVGADNAVVIVGLDLRIRRFTETAQKLLQLAPGDVGRSISALDGFAGGKPMQQRAAEVMSTLVPGEDEVLAINHRWYGLRIKPYRTSDHAIRGAVITLADIDMRKRAQDMAHDVAEYARQFLAAIVQPLVIVDDKLRVLWVNDAYCKQFLVTADEIVGQPLATGVGREWATPELVDRLQGALREGTGLTNVAVEHQPKDRPARTVRIGANRVPLLTDTPLLLVSIDGSS